MNAVPQNSAIVLVHGAWEDGSCWSNILVPLRRHGLKVVCAPIPLTSLTDDIAALRRALERTSGPVVLAGHAYGGAVIREMSEDRVKSLVYIAALAPDEGETVAKIFYRDQPHPGCPRVGTRCARFSVDAGTGGFMTPLPIKLRSNEQASWLRCNDQSRSSAFKNQPLLQRGKRSRRG